jgi:hypothetical protein
MRPIGNEVFSPSYSLSPALVTLQQHYKSSLTKLFSSFPTTFNTTLTLFVYSYVKWNSTPTLKTFVPTVHSLLTNPPQVESILTPTSHRPLPACEGTPIMSQSQETGILIFDSPHPKAIPSWSLTPLPVLLAAAASSATPTTQSEFTTFTQMLNTPSSRLVKWSPYYRFILTKPSSYPSAPNSSDS